jgi:hypothetical protein
MAKISVPKTQLEGFTTVPAGVYEVRLDGFKPVLSKKKDSVNLEPVLHIINHPNQNDQRLFEHMNTGCWYMQDVVHAFGLEMVDNGDKLDIPGEFLGPDNDPTQWSYTGPLVGRTAKVRTIVGEYNSKPQTYIDQWYCALPACREKHSTKLQK